MKTIKTLRLLMNFLFLLFITTIICSCEKSDPLAACKADPTCEYFSCKVDGKSWTPYCESAFLGCDAVDVQYYRDLNGGGLEIYSSNDNNNNSGINLLAQNIQKVDINYLLNLKTKYFLDQGNESKKYNIDSNYINSIHLTKIDTVNFILEGAFTFTGSNEVGEIKTITDGEFRQQYRY